MILKKNTWVLLALICGIYAILITIIINPFIIIQSSYSALDLFILFGASSLSTYVLFTFSKQDNRIGNIAFLSSFGLSLILAGVVIWFKVGTAESNFLLFISSYFIAAIPLTIIALLFFLFNKFKNVNQTGNSISPDNSEVNYFQLKNTKGKVTFKINSEDIIYFEANDNYVVTFYKNEEGDVKKSMDRISLKKVEDILTDKGVKFERVHKSYLLNPKRVKQVSGRSQAYKIIMTDTDFEIPVSRKFDVSNLES